MNISAQDKIIFVRHLAMLLKSGITILEALQILASQAKSSGWKKVLLQITNDIQNGSTLAKSLSKHPRIFDPFFVGIVAVGEDSGTIDESLTYLHEHLAKSLALRKKIQNALSYPLLVVTVACIAGFGVMVFLMPKLLDLFQGLDVKLPPVTQAFISIATFLQAYGIVILVLLILGIIAYRLLLYVPYFKNIVDAISLRIPLLGPILQNIALTNMCRNIGIMMKSGLPVTQSLDIAKKMMNQAVFEKYLASLLTAVTSGKAISQELENKKYSFVPVIATRMIAVGEKTGKLDETMLYLADFFEREVDETTKNIVVILEPLLLFIVGLFVAFVALSIITPIYELTGSIQR